MRGNAQPGLTFRFRLLPFCLGFLSCFVFVLITALTMQIRQMPLIIALAYVVACYLIYRRSVDWLKNIVGGLLIGMGVLICLSYYLLGASSLQ